MPGNNYLYSTGEFLEAPEVAVQPVNLPVNQLVNLPTFDPNAGRQEAYNKRWNAYLQNLGQTQNKINVKKARKNFDQQFNQDWNNEAASRQVDFISQQAKLKQLSIIDKWRAERAEADRLSLELDIRDYEAAGYTFDINKGWIKPEVPEVKSKIDWNAKAVAGMGAGTTIDDVKKWQIYYNQLNKNKKGFTALSEDGLFGKNTKAAYDAWKNSTAGKLYATMTAKGATWNGSSWKLPKVEESSNNQIYDFGTGQYISNEEYHNGLSAKQPGLGIKLDSEIPTFEGANSYAFEYTMQNDFDKLYNEHLQSKYNNKYGGIDQNALRKDAGYLAAWDKFRGLYQQGNVWRDGLINHYTRLAKGGQINKFSNGGKPMNDQELLKAFAQFLIMDAEALGIKLETPEDVQRYVQQLGDEGMAEKQREFMQKMQGTPSRRLGGHLQYLNKLKGNCQEGEELVYMKEGGRVCPKCVKKASSGTQAPEEKKHQNTVKQWKADRAKAKDEAARDSIAINKYNDQETMANKGHKGKFKNGVWTPNRKDYTKKNSCGAKMNK